MTLEVPCSICMYVRTYIRWYELHCMQDGCRLTDWSDCWQHALQHATRHSICTKHETTWAQATRVYNRQQKCRTKMSCMQTASAATARWNTVLKCFIRMFHDCFSHSVSKAFSVEYYLYMDKSRLCVNDQKCQTCTNSLYYTHSRQCCTVWSHDSTSHLIDYVWPGHLQFHFTRIWLFTALQWAYSHMYYTHTHVRMHACIHAHCGTNKRMIPCTHCKTWHN